jgi:Mn2+/Fe2+ NRAMP family transporter
MTNLLPILHRKASELRIRRIASEVRHRLADRNAASSLRGFTQSNSTERAIEPNTRALNSFAGWNPSGPSKRQHVAIDPSPQSLQPAPNRQDQYRMAEKGSSMTSIDQPAAEFKRSRNAVLDDAHIGHIHGDVGPRLGWRARWRTLAAILGPGLIVMVGDNDTGAFGTYTQAGQNYGTTMLWTLMLLIPVLYVNQEMVVRLGAVTGVGHLRLILERFGKFWGAFSVIDLFVLNALTIVTEFIGVSLALRYLGFSQFWGVLASAAIVMAAVSTGDFRRFERFAIFLVFGSFLLVPVIFLVHPPVGELVRDLFVPRLPEGAKLSEVMLLIIAIVGTTVAPWQLFFQQSYLVDKRITPRFIKYERWDLAIGIALVMIGAIAMMGFCAAILAGKPEFGNYTDALGAAIGLEKYAGELPAILFALALLDASIIGAAAVSLATAYAIGDVFSLRHSLHRRPQDAKGFYAVYFGLIVVAALAPGIPLGLLTNAVQTLAGVLLPSATVFLLLLANDKSILGPWVNTRTLNLCTGTIVACWSYCLSS